MTTNSIATSSNVTPADAAPFLRAAVEWARTHYFAYDRRPGRKTEREMAQELADSADVRAWAIGDAEFALVAGAASAEERAQRAESLALNVRGASADRDASTGRFYAFVLGCVLAATPAAQ